MKLLTFFYLLTTFVGIDSDCKRKAPRKEGFVRHTCVPGFYEGSCLIILKKLPFHNAIESCRYDYGGRLATAPTQEAIQIWRRTIHFDTKITVKENTRFWVGYGRTAVGKTKFGFKYDVPDKEMQKFVSLSIWNRVFGKPRTSAKIKWEEGIQKKPLDAYSCTAFGVIFNPNNMKFDVKHNGDEHYALCETPRWAKLQCDEGWHLIPQLRMCLKHQKWLTDFIDAHNDCREEKSFIAVAQNKAEVEMLRAVIGQKELPPTTSWIRYNNSLSVPSFWAGVKSLNHTIFSLDGTKPVYSSMSPENLCQTHSFADIVLTGTDHRYGMSIGCKEYYLPYMCQRFADQSLTKNL